MKRIGIIGASTFNPNKGCEALLFSFVHLIHRALRNEQLEIYLIYSFNEKQQIDLPVEENNYRINVLPSLSMLGVSCIVRSVWSLKAIKQYKSLDIVFALGYGDSFSDIYGEQRFREVNEQIRIMQYFKIPLIFAPQTIGPFYSPKLKAQAVKSLNKADFIFVRDGLSNNFVKDNCTNQNISEHVDMAFHMPYKKYHFGNQRKINTGLSISALLWKGGYTGKNEFGLHIDYKELMLSIIEDLLSNPAIQIHITPHVVSPNFSIYDDYALALDLQKEYGLDKIIVSPFFKDPIEAKSYIAGLDFFIGSRMHACIAAFSSGVPVLPLAYSRKFCGLFINTIGYNHIINLYEVTSKEAILYKIQECINNRTSIQREIIGKMDRIEADGEALISEFRKLIM